MAAGECTRSTNLFFLAFASLLLLIGTNINTCHRGKEQWDISVPFLSSVEMLICNANAHVRSIELVGLNIEKGENEVIDDTRPYVSTTRSPHWKGRNQNLLHRQCSAVHVRSFSLTCLEPPSGGGMHVFPFVLGFAENNDTIRISSFDGSMQNTLNLLYWLLMLRLASAWGFPQMT